jgi:rubredoxin
MHSFVRMKIGHKFERVHEEKDRLERLFKVTLSCDCPVCGDLKCVVAEIDSAALDRKEICAKRMACTNCGFVVSNNQPNLSEVLLDKQISESKATILAEFGL